MSFKIADKLQNLILLRWVALGAILLIFFVVKLFMRDYPVHSLSPVLIGAYIFSNVSLIFLNRFVVGKRGLDFALLAVLLADIFFLTLLLKYHGGSHNPFSILFLAICGVGALVLSLRSLTLLIGASLLALGFIYLNLFQVPEVSFHLHSDSYPFHLKGMWLANSMGVFLICGWIFYLKQINEKVALRHERAQKILADIERVESMGRLVAQAAHQINTPLATLQLGLSELKDAQQRPLSPEECSQWYVDMQRAVDQIHEMVCRIRSEPPHSLFLKENPQKYLLKDLVENWLEAWSHPRKVEVDLKFQISPIQIREDTAEDLRNVLTALLDNALDAMKNPNQQIWVVLEEKETDLKIKVRDLGEGMEEETRRRALDPLFTTKLKGTGLGLYVCHQIAQKYDGFIHIDSKPALGTQVEVSVKKESL